MRPIVTILIVFTLQAYAQDTERAIRTEIIVNAPVNDVWNAWTTSAGIRTFFAPDANVELRVGGPFQIFFAPTAPTGLKGADDMLIMAYQEHRMLAFTWNAPPEFSNVRKQWTHVTVRLKKLTATTTKVFLTQDGWGESAEWDSVFNYFSEVWPFVLTNLKKRFDSGPLDWKKMAEQ